MTLFKITCDTCQTSLNVRQKSAIGQILACPKCSSMVQVTPPKDWQDSDPDGEPTPKSKKKPFVKPVPDPKLPETVSTVSGSVAEGLQNEEGGKPKNAEQRWQGENTNSEPTSPADSDSRKPMLPGDQWDSSRSKQRKKLLFAFTTAIAVLVFGVGAIVFAAMQLTGGKNDEADKVADANPASKTDSEKSKNPDSELSKKDDRSSTKTNDQKNSVDPSKLKNPDDKGTGKNPDKKSTIGPDDEKKKLNPGKNKTGSNDSKEKKKEQPKKKDDGAPPDFEPKEDSDVEGLPDFFRELDEFSIVFEQDEPLLKLREAFEEDDLPGEFGLTRFYIAKSLKKTPKPDQALNVPVAGLSFQQITLLEYLDFHYQLTSVPVAVDVTPILLSGIKLDKKFDLQVTEKTVLEILREVASQLDLQVVKGTNSLVLTIKDRESLVEVDYPVDDIAPTAEGRQKLIDQVQLFVDKKSWSTTGGEGIITANDAQNSIVVKHFGWAQARVREFFRHVRIRKGLEPKNPNPNFPGGQHRLLLADKARKQEVTIFRSDPVSLSELFAQIAKEQDIHVFVNWEATGDKVLPSGNLPLAIESERFEQFIDELAATARLEIVWHSDRILELTSSVGSSSNLTFESYDIQDATNKSFSASDLLAALRKLLATNNFADFEIAEIGLDLQNQNAIYAVLPQTAHQNVLKILNSVKTAVKK